MTTWAAFARDATRLASVPILVFLTTAISFRSLDSAFSDSNVTTQTNHICSQTRTCTGFGNGECDAAGFFCSDAPGNPCSETSSNCHWTYTWSCNSNPNWDCRSGDLSYISNDCGGVCYLVVYNMCECACGNRGTGTVESGEANSCESVNYHGGGGG